MHDPLPQIDLLELFQSRRTCYRFASSKDFPVAFHTLENCLEAARWAPNHKLTQPWRFWHLGTKSRTVLADIYAENRASKKSLDDSESYDCFYQKALEKFSAIPEIILVGQVLSENPVVQKEDYAACACAIQNFQLMAWNQSLGVQWSTGPILKDPRTYRLLGIDSDRIELIGALYIGHRDPDCSQPNAKRKPIEEILTRLD
ncbi:nitroreductase [Thiomicrorhabdus sp. ZW0627]|uniref:nitroreductase family protein n=1 Tax=Thiomicrorhabdus sp. ZW0627 TaxID=3039774 RepID=UPI0024363B5C|nr:nitroreductase [Thiomicrorhabdus sp. ZW0627]MDG6774231.1 nitroreductase [Thiomicrorhabdus sp. ZW0627]